jgi:hypothetical protein
MLACRLVDCVDSPNVGGRLGRRLRRTIPAGQFGYSRHVVRSSPFIIVYFSIVRSCVTVIRIDLPFLIRQDQDPDAGLMRIFYFYIF